MLFPLRAMSENLLKTLPKGAEPLASGPAPPDEDDEFCIWFNLVVDCHHERRLCRLYCDRDVVSCEFDRRIRIRCQYSVIKIRQSIKIRPSGDTFGKALCSL